MPYAQQTWTDNVTPVDAAHMLHIEAGIAAVEAEALPQPVVNGQWVKGVGGAAVWAAITAADISGYPSDQTKALRGDGTWRSVIDWIDGGGASFGTVVKMQAGQTSIPTLGTGTDSNPVAANVTLPFAWPVAHLMFLASAVPSANWTGFQQKMTGAPSSNSAGYVACINGISQNVTIFWMSFGK